MSEELCALGVLGLTPLGQSLAAHHASRGVRVCVGDEDPAFVPQVVREFRNQMTEAGVDDDDDDDGDEGGGGDGGGEAASSSSLRPSRCMLSSIDAEEMVGNLRRPRSIVVFGTHGDDGKFREMWTRMLPALEDGDAVLRWGSEEDGNDYKSEFHGDATTVNLATAEAAPRGVGLLEMIRMDRDRTTAFEEKDTPHAFAVGGPKEAYDRLEPFLASFAAMGLVGNDVGSVHYARMIQRTVENGILQAWAEASGVLRSVAGLENPDIGRTMKKWSDEGSLLSSYLLVASSRIFYKRDHVTKKGFVIDHIVDSASWEPAHTWTALEAAKLGVPIPTTNAALETRFLGAMKDERVEASSILKVPELPDTPSVLKDQIGEDLQSAVYCACVCLLAECFSVFLAAAEAESWDVNLKECVRLWNLPGSILESTLLKNVHAAFPEDVSEMRSLLTTPGVAKEMGGLHMSWRRIVALTAASAIPCPMLSASLAYYDSYRSRTMPIGLAKAYRDYYDASGYDRFEQEGRFTTLWNPDHTKQEKRKGMEDQPRKRGKRKKSSTDDVAPKEEGGEK
ncbi:hypothetical protein ACHAWF_004022 [Thalassiosira exigua]